MKVSKLFIIFLSLLILITACSNSLSTKSIEPNHIDKMYIEYALLFVETAEPIPVVNILSQDLIKYLVSPQILSKTEKLNDHYAKIQKIAVAENKKDRDIIDLIKTDLESLNAVLKLGENYNKTGKYLPEDLTQEEILKNAEIITTINIASNFNQQNIEYWKQNREIIPLRPTSEINAPQKSSPIPDLKKEPIATAKAQQKATPSPTIKKEPIEPAQNLAKVPQKAYDIANKVISNNGVAPEGYKGGRTYYNSGRNGEQVLPKGNYKEYDINPYIQGVNRGAERIVIRNNSEAWYTSDHYMTFTKMK